MFGNECDKCNRGWDSSDSFVEWHDLKRRIKRAEARDDEAESKHKTCSMCGTWLEEPHFLLHALDGRLAEPLDPHSFEMTPSLWSTLPQECLEKILGRLPFGSRVRFSAVSKTWLSLLSSSDFKGLVASEGPPPTLPVCSLEYQPGKLAPCKPRASDFARLSEIRQLEVLKVGLSFLPPKFQAFHSSEYVVQDGLVCIFKLDRYKRPEKPKVEKYKVEIQRPQKVLITYSDGTGVGDEDGDADDEDGDGDDEEEEEEEEEDEDEDEDDDEGYYTGEDEDDYYGGSSKKVVGMSFCVVNPIMRTFKELPPEFGEGDDFEEHRTRWKVQLEVEASGHFAVMVLCMRKQKPTVSIYRSKDNSWKATALTEPLAFPGPSFDGDDPNWPQYVLCNGGLCRAEEDNSMNIHSLESGLIVWDGNWFEESLDESVDEDEDTEPRAMRKVFAWQGRIFCFEQGFEEDKVDFGVLELERSPYIWRKVSFLPENLQETLLEPVKCRPRKDRKLVLKLMKMNAKRRITLDGATLLGDTMYFTVGIGFEKNHKLRLCKHVVGYNIPSQTWSLICQGVHRFFCSNLYHLFRPSDVVV